MNRLVPRQELILGLAPRLTLNISNQNELLTPSFKLDAALDHDNAAMATKNATLASGISVYPQMSA
jgi:hypothetical protein